MTDEPNPIAKDSSPHGSASAWRPNAVASGVAAAFVIAVALLVGLRVAPELVPHGLGRTRGCVTSTPSVDPVLVVPEGSPTANGLMCTIRPWSAGSDPTVAP